MFTIIIEDDNDNIYEIDGLDYYEFREWVELAEQESWEFAAEYQ